MISESKKIKSVTVTTVSLSIYHEVMGPDAMILVFRMLSFKLAFSLSSFTFIKMGKVDPKGRVRRAGKGAGEVGTRTARRQRRNVRELGRGEDRKSVV